MERDVFSWTDDTSYQLAKQLIQSLKVVNDAAEREVALATTFTSSLTRREDEKQLLFQMVETHRKRLPQSTKNAALSVYTD